MDELVKKFSILFRRSGLDLDRQLKKFGLSRGQMMYLMCICENEGDSQEQLAAELRINKGAVARAVQKFERDGFINRLPSEKDRRQYRLFATEKTRRIYQAIRTIEADWEENVTRNLNAGERSLLVSLLDRLIEDME